MKPKLLLTASIALLLSLLIAVPVKRIRYSSDATPNNEKASNNKFRQFEAIPIEGAVGPESFAFDPLGGGPYTGISDGRIIKWDQNQRRWINFAITSPQRYALIPYHKPFVLYLVDSIVEIIRWNYMVHTAQYLSIVFICMTRPKNHLVAYMAEFKLV